MLNREHDSVEQRAVWGAQNLLRNCVHISRGDTLLMIVEDQQLGYFDPEVVEIIANEARKIGAKVLTISTSRADGPDDVPEALNAAMLHVDHTIFLNRIGDQMRFRTLPGDGTKTTVYTLDRDTLASRAAAFDHGFMTRLVDIFNAHLAAKRTWRITCPAGTNISGQMPEPQPPTDATNNFTVRLFPMSVHRPIPAVSMNGKIVLDRWVTGTNTHAYSPEVHYLQSPITAQIENGHVTDLQGDPAEVQAFRAHSKMVADKFGLDETLIHSWHSGLNPGTGYFASAKADPVRWNGMIFGSPRHLHFHTCGDYPPGEINWHIIDPTVHFDDDVVLENGEVSFFQTDAVQTLLQEYDLSDTSMATNQDIGL